MRRIVVALIAIVLVLYLTWGGGLRRYEEYRVGGALHEAGFSRHRADCMAHRMVKRLSPVQLWKLQHFAEHKRGLQAALRGIEPVGDDEALSVTASAAALCAMGLAQ